MFVADFVNIKTVYDGAENRTIENLARIYRDREQLTDIVGGITASEFNGEIIGGKKILLKPNWVLHNNRGSDEICLRTHNNFLLAVLETVLKYNPQKVIIGDAPVQGADWKKIVSEKFIYEVNILSERYKIPVIIKDFRRVTFNPNLNLPLKERNPLSDYVIFDLGKSSLLEPISNDKEKRFRVTDYIPERMWESHSKGVHKYCISKELFDNDIIISVPKVKTHQKTGITNALKNLVGLNGDKDYLPHHRIGGTGRNGDCYPGNNILRYFSEKILDTANRSQGKFKYRILRKISGLVWRLSLPSSVHNLSAGWYGNDTTWRMVLDINKIAVFGAKTGQVLTHPQRQIFSICDGIIGGQGNGPLKPDPLPLGVICFSNHSAMTDVTIAYLMGFDINKISLLKNSLYCFNSCEIRLTLNNKIISLEELKQYSIKTTPPPGWIDYLNSDANACNS